MGGGPPMVLLKVAMRAEDACWNNRTAPSRDCPWVLHELGFGRLVAEAVGLAVKGRVDPTVRSTSSSLARPCVHMLSNSPVTARAAVLRPSNRAPAKADVM